MQKTWRGWCRTRPPAYWTHTARPSARRCASVAAVAERTAAGNVPPIKKVGTAITAAASASRTSGGAAETKSPLPSQADIDRAGQRHQPGCRGDAQRNAHLEQPVQAQRIVHAIRQLAQHGAAQPQPGHEDCQHRGHGGRRRAKHEPQLAHPGDLKHQCRTARCEHQQRQQTKCSRSNEVVGLT